MAKVFVGNVLGIRGWWKSGETYNQNDIVYFNTGVFICIKDGTTTSPTLKESDSRWAMIGQLMGVNNTQYFIE